MTHAGMIAEMLGGRTVFKQRVSEDAELEEIVRAGIPAQALYELADRTDTTLTALTSVVGIDRGTFARRARMKARLKTDESDRVVRVARIAALAVDAMGEEDGLAWLHEPNYALGDRVPIELLETEVGARQVEQVIGRIERGVFS